MSTQLTFAPFNPQGETWDSYVARFECFLISNGYTEISGDRKRSYFLGFCGPDMFETARALFAPVSIHDVPWEEFLKTLQDHYAPAPSRCARRYKFYLRNQEDGESINDFVAALRRAALYCEFDNLGDYLLDRLVFGVRDGRLKRRLLAIQDLTFQTALSEARAFELSSQSLAAMDSSVNLTQKATPVAVKAKVPSEGEELAVPVEEEVCRLAVNRGREQPSTRSRPPLSPCRGCGGNHLRANCSFRGAVCWRCGARGHVAKVCRFRRSPPPSARDQRDSPNFGSRGQRRSSFARKEDCNAIYTVPRLIPTYVRETSSSTDKISVQVLLGEAVCSMQVDTGSAHSLVS